MQDYIKCLIQVKGSLKCTILKIAQKKSEVLQVNIKIYRQGHKFTFLLFFIIFSDTEDSGSNKRSRRGRTGSQDDRRSSIDVSLSRIRRRPEDFYSGLNAEVTAIEMEDLSSGGRLYHHRVMCNNKNYEYFISLQINGCVAPKSHLQFRK